MRVLELFAGIGGVAEAIHTLPVGTCEVVQAVDIDSVAKSVYLENFRADYRVAEIASLRWQELAASGADLWWMSPPCLPFTVRGNRDDLRDQRNSALMSLTKSITLSLPTAIVVENVPGFELSETCRNLTAKLHEAKYEIQCCTLCPTEFGWMNRRRRVYLLAWQRDRANDFRGVDWSEFSTASMNSESMIDSAISPESHAELYMGKDIVERYWQAIDRITPCEFLNHVRPTACFASSYGKTYLHAGSYLCTDATTCRRFAPEEVQMQLGFRRSFHFPEDLSTRRKWSLLGNSLTIPIVREVLKQLSEHLNRSLPL